MQYFPILQYKLLSFNIQDDRSIREFLANKFKITYTAIRFSHLQFEMWLSVWMSIDRLTLQHNKEFIINVYFSMVLSMCNLQKRLIRVAFWVLLKAMNEWKQTAQRLNLQERLLKINKRNIIRWNIYRDNNFHSRRQVLIKVSVSKNIESLSLKLKLTDVLSRIPGVCFFQRWTLGKKIAQIFIVQPEL